MKDEFGRHYAPSTIIGKNQLTATIKPLYWKIFPLEQRAIVMNSNGNIITRKIRMVGSGKQRIVTIPAQDNDLFKPGQIVKIYPSSYKLTLQIPTNIDKKSQSLNKQTNEANKTNN